MPFCLVTTAERALVASELAMDTERGTDQEVLHGCSARTGTRHELGANSSAAMLDHPVEKGLDRHPARRLVKRFRQGQASFASHGACRHLAAIE